MPLLDDSIIPRAYLHHYLTGLFAIVCLYQKIWAKIVIYLYSSIISSLATQKRLLKNVYYSEWMNEWPNHFYPTEFFWNKTTSALFYMLLEPYSCSYLLVNASWSFNLRTNAVSAFEKVRLQRHISDFGCWLSNHSPCSYALNDFQHRYAISECSAPVSPFTQLA